MITVPVYIPPIKVSSKAFNKIAEDEHSYNLLKLYKVEWPHRERDRYPYRAHLLRTIVTRIQGTPFVFVDKQALTPLWENHSMPRDYERKTTVDIDGVDTTQYELDVKFHADLGSDKELTIEYTQIRWGLQGFTGDQLRNYNNLNDGSADAAALWMTVCIDELTELLEDAGYIEGSLDTAEISAHLAEWLLEE